MASYKEWINLIDIDYYTAFLKSWIAFNSWYKNRPEYEAFNQDRQIIDEIKNNSDSLLKTRIINLIKMDNFESKSFKQDIGNLHMALSQAAIYIHNKNNPPESITFEKIAISNLTKTHSQVISNIHYSFERIRNGAIKSKIKTTNNNPPNILLDLEQPEYNDLALEASSEFMNLTDEQKKTCSQLYKNINPYTYHSIIGKTKGKNKTLNNLKLGEITFINDIDKISIAIIEILFMLRNTLIHGSVEPNASNNQVYKFAYSILYTLLKNL